MKVSRGPRVLAAVFVAYLIGAVFSVAAVLSAASIERGLAQ